MDGDVTKQPPVPSSLTPKCNCLLTFLPCIPHLKGTYRCVGKRRPPPRACLPNWMGRCAHAAHPKRQQFDLSLADHGRRRLATDQSSLAGGERVTRPPQLTSVAPGQKFALRGERQLGWEVIFPHRLLRCVLVLTNG